MPLRNEQRQHIETLIRLSEGQPADLDGCREVIRRSWERCVGEYRLDPGRPRPVRVLTQQALKEHREQGANIEVDVAYQYLTFFLEDDEKLAQIGKDYAAGRITTGEVKATLIEVLQALVARHQEARAKVTEEEVDYFMSQAKFAKAHTTVL